MLLLLSLNKMLKTMDISHVLILRDCSKIIFQHTGFEEGDIIVS